MIVLGIESSCDETAAALVSDGKKLLGSSIASSVDLHASYGGVVPEIAARSHLEVIIPTISSAMDQAGLDWSGIDAIAVTYGPGLGGSLLIGVMTARSLAISQNKPLYGINHVEAHPYAAFITEVSAAVPTPYRVPAEVPLFPALALIVSGGHTQLVLFRGHGDYRLLGQTADDAVGEAFDKVAKLLGFSFPGGPSIALAAKDGDPRSVPLPIARMDNDYDFSFSGLKTAVLRASQAAAGERLDFPSYKLPERLSTPQKADIAASFQSTAIETLVRKTVKAYKEFLPASVIVAGGVAANQELRRQMSDSLPIPIIYPDIGLCTDNAVMVASLAYFRHKSGEKPADAYTLSPDPSLSM